MNGGAGTWSGDVLVVGAGPAGLAVAAECARRGLTVLLVDENQRPGGQITRRRFLDRPSGSGPDVEPSVPEGVSFRSGTVCHGFRDGRQAVLTSGHELWRTRTRAVVIATGAAEKVLPVPGWTLPGVMTAGAAQTFLKGSGFLPYRRVLVAGSGPLLLAVASQLISAGVRVVGVAEATRPGARQWRDALRTLAAPGLLAQGAGYTVRLARAGVRVRTGTGIARIEGDGRVTGARLRRLRRDWSFAGTPEEHVACDAVLLSHGFSSAADLAAQGGADIEWDAQRQTWRPVRDVGFRTSVPWIRAVGDCAGVGGAQRAELEGRLAGMLLAAELTGRPAGSGRIRSLRRRLDRLETFRRGMDRLFRPGLGAASWPEPETQVCRCQESTRAEVDRAMDNGVADLHALKLWTRAGMGPCQGRICAPVLSTLLAARGHEPARLPPPSIRYPVRPLPIAALCRSAAPEGGQR
ncbi:FAD-dependent oxidoreductase [Actinoallomurus sp. NBC_01490]|jgi:NADPH-dependent 2,4-dienoyl-CoA reductase/sulfur reductase-like enzyme|uniref:NAD(P)/FAD-dependent oxidoreductase n=1 Tax=Actinoallomurus sp. NBC_01490 TaxID=2903557 RepID=UPI002E2F5A36|nr:NAD(P)/FAD-dependent oxidoreductase [Actinoallomurus sp. NBC_01490]